MAMWEHAVAVLRETGNPSLRWGDHRLLHMIANKAGMPSNGPKTSRRVLRALSRTPGELIKDHVMSGSREVLIFKLRNP